MQYSIRFAILLALGVTTIAGCRSYPVQPMPQLGAGEAPARTVIAGTEFGAKAYTDGVESKAVFNYDLMSKGFLPVLLIVDNNSRSELEILRARIELQSPSGERLEPVSGEAVATGEGRNAMAEAIFFFGIFSYDNANKFNDALVRDWVDKGFPVAQIVRPGHTVKKFLYFRVGRGFSPSGATLNVPFQRDSRDSREIAVLKFK